MALSKCESITDENGKELLSHGNQLLPIAVYDDNISKNPVCWHWHDELEAGIITSGAVLISTETGQYRLEEGQGFFINSGVLHQMIPDLKEKKQQNCIRLFFIRILLVKKITVFFMKNMYDQY